MTGTISPSELRRMLDSQPSPRLVDVRTPAEFHEVHVAGAVNKPLDRLDPTEFSGSELSGGGAPLIVICKSGSRSAMACEKLVKAGLADVVQVAGGTDACVEAGIEVKRGEKAISLERQVRIAAGSLVVLGVALSFVHPAWLGLSAFVGAGLVFAGVTDTCGMGMLLAKMPWNQAGA